MTHGAPDNYQVSPRNIVYVLQDDAELAIRLGAVSSIDRLGNILFFDDFSNGKEAFYPAFNGANGKVAISSQYFKGSGFSLMLKAGSNGDRYAYILAYFPYPDPSKIGYEINFSFDSNVSYISFWFDALDGITYHNTAIKLDVVNNKLQYWGIDSTFHDIDSTPYPTYALGYFHSLKFVIDMLTGYYVRLIYDGVSYNLSSYQFLIFADAEAPTLIPSINVYSNNGVNGISYIDSIILTRDEP